MKMIALFMTLFTLELVAKPCSEGGCPIQMIERLREEKKAQRVNTTSPAQKPVAQMEEEEEEEEEEPYDGEDMDEDIDTRFL